MKRKRLEELVIDPTDPDLRPERRCRHRAGDPDCDCHPEDETEDDDADDPDGTTDEQDAEVVAVVETLPAPLTSAQVTERELRRLEAYRGEVLSDVTDGKAAKNLDAKRLEVRRARTTAARICKEQREDAIKVQKQWIGIEKGIAERLEPVEDHLEAEAKRHDAWKAEQARIAEAARLDKIRQRVETVVEIGIALDMAKAEGLDELDWNAYVTDARAEAAIRQAAQERAAALTAAGDECTADEARELTQEQYDWRLQVAQKAQRERDELARIQEEERQAEEKRIAEEAAAEAARIEAELRAQIEAERAARERLERGAQRMRELAMLGAPTDIETLADMTPEAYSFAVATAIEDKRHRDELAAQERQAQAVRDAEMARLRQEAADRERAAAEELEKAESEANAAALAAAQAEAARLEAERVEALRPEREKIAGWARDTIDGMPSTPDIKDADLIAAMRATVEMVRDSLLDLEASMKG